MRASRTWCKNTVVLHEMLLHCKILIEIYDDAYCPGCEFVGSAVEKAHHALNVKPFHFTSVTSSSTLANHSSVKREPRFLVR